MFWQVEDEGLNTLNLDPIEVYVGCLSESFTPNQIPLNTIYNVTYPGVFYKYTLVEFLMAPVDFDCRTEKYELNLIEPPNFTELSLLKKDCASESDCRTVNIPSFYL